MTPKAQFDSLNLPATHPDAPFGIGIFGKVLARANGIVTVQVADATLRVQESDIVSVAKLASTVTSGDDTLLQLLIKPEAMIERVQLINLSATKCDCDTRTDPMLLSLAAERPAIQSFGEMAILDRKRQQWAQERGLGGDMQILSQCSYSTSYSTTTWFSDGTKTDSQTDRYTCD